MSARSVQRSAATFKVRRRALSPERMMRFDTWMHQRGIAPTGSRLDWPTVFGRTADVVLDIGFGHGESTLQRAVGEPGIDIVGIEVHTPGVATVLEAAEAGGLDNIRIVHGDVVPFLDRIGADTLAGVTIYFPDPWPKVRHHHRRLVEARVVAALTDRTRVGGTVHMATDSADYADAMRVACAADERLTGGVVERPADRAMTRFEQRGLDEGRVAVDLIYRRTI